jgi:hypothetical protein
MKRSSHSQRTGSPEDAQVILQSSSLLHWADRIDGGLDGSSRHEGNIHNINIHTHDLMANDLKSLRKGLSRPVLLFLMTSYNV